MGEYWSFDKLITPALVRAMFWILLVVVLFNGLSHLFGGEFWMGLLILIVGPLGVRIYCEIVIVIFQINNTLTEIRDNQSRNAAPAVSSPPPSA